MRRFAAETFCERATIEAPQGRLIAPTIQASILSSIPSGREEEGSFRLVDAVALQICDFASGVEFLPFGFFVTSAAASSDCV